LNELDWANSVVSRSMLYVEADARMDTYDDKEGKTQSSLSLIASMYT
jgi:single-stranded DNA-binding protein